MARDADGNVIQTVDETVQPEEEILIVRDLLGRVIEKTMFRRPRRIPRVESPWPNGDQRFL